MNEDTLLLARCGHCAAHTFPAQAYGCRRCGRHDALEAVPAPQVPALKNFVTVHTELVPGMAVPCVIGEVELAPGVVEEALIGVADERSLALEMPLKAVHSVGDGGKTRWHFVPKEAA